MAAKPKTVPKQSIASTREGRRIIAEPKSAADGGDDDLDVEIRTVYYHLSLSPY